MKFPYYPGCSLRTSSREYDISVQAAFDFLDIELCELDDWCCCGASSAHSVSSFLDLSLCAINLQKSEAQAAKPLIAACAACYNRLRMAREILAKDAEQLDFINKKSNLHYQAQQPVWHLLDLLVREVGFEQVKARVSKPLAGLKVASYYGCLLVRHSEYVAFDDTENPVIMDQLMAALGAEVIDWPYKVECCGASLSISKTEVTHKLCNDILTYATKAGANCIVTACPLCQTNLDLRQEGAADQFQGKYNLPIYYFTELMAVAFGLDLRRSCLRRHLIDSEALLDRHNLL